MYRQAWWAAVHGAAKQSDRIENQVIEQNIAPTLNAVNVPRLRHQGALCTAQNRQHLNTSSWSPELALPLSWPCPRAQRPELDGTAGASSQGTDSEPRPPGLLLGVKLHPGPSTQNWRVKGSGGHQSPPSSQKERRGGAPSPSRAPLQLSSAWACSSSSLLRACPPAPLTHDSPPNPGPLSFYRQTLLTSTGMTQLMLLEGHERVSRSS